MHSVRPEYDIEISEDLLKPFSPYKNKKEHIIQLGKYEMNIDNLKDFNSEEWNFWIPYAVSDEDVS